MLTAAGCTSGTISHFFVISQRRWIVQKANTFGEKQGQELRNYELTKWIESLSPTHMSTRTQNNVG